ncbi:isoprenoid synthase domain-containing protein [Infundibulicybe gibba]|nr:isoprenoid synthase domain-containing protein [Infundibulicybe gibba]
MMTSTQPLQPAPKTALAESTSHERANPSSTLGPLAGHVVEVKPIQDVLRMFLREMNIPFPTLTYDASLAKATCDEALRLGFQEAHIFSKTFQKALQPGVALIMTIYPHLEMSTRLWISLYMTCTVYFDEVAEADIEAVKAFNMLFITNQPQQHPVLDSYAKLLRLSADHFTPTISALVVTSTLDYTTALLLEKDYQGMPLHEAALNYPRYLRNLTGIARPYALFVFPANIPLQDYIQILPEMTQYLEDVNDIFSLYKEELAGEDDNHVSILAKIRGWDKITALRHLTQISIDGSRRIVKVLQSTNPEACEMAITRLLAGYVGYHALSRQRYKLDDLCLDA